LIAPVKASFAAFVVDFDLGLRAGAMVVQIRVEVRGVEVLEGLGVSGVEVTVAHVFADHRAILGFHQSVIVAVPRPAFGLLDKQLVEQLGHGLVDELAAVIGVKAADAEGKLPQQGGQHRLQPGFADACSGGHDLPLRDLIDGVDVVHAFGPPADRPGARCRPADSRAGLADRAAAARQSSPPWAWSWRSSGGVRDNAAVAAGCTGGPPRSWPAAGIPPGRTADTRAAECAAWPVRSSFHAPHRRWPAAPRRRGYSVAESDAADSGRAGHLRGPDSGQSGASPGPGSGRSSSPDSAATSRAPGGLVSGIAVGAEPAPPSRKPAGDFRLRTGCLRWLLEKPRSAPGSASLLRARWLSILSMPPAPGSSCIGNCLLLQAHLVLEKTSDSKPVTALIHLLAKTSRMSH